MQDKLFEQDTDSSVLCNISSLFVLYKMVNQMGLEQSSDIAQEVLEISFKILMASKPIFMIFYILHQHFHILNML